MKKNYSGYIDFIKLTLFCFIAGSVVGALFDSSFWGVFSGVFVFMFHYLSESEFFLDKNDQEKITKIQNGFFNIAFWRNLVNSLWLLGFTALTTFLIMEYVI